MKIVVLDGYTTNPGDISWEALEALGEVTVHDRTEPERIVQRGQGAEVLMTNDVPLSREVLAQLPELKYIGVMSTGYNHVDARSATALGITVTNVPDYSTPAVAQTTIALLLELCHRAGAHSDAVHGGQWHRAPDYCFWNHPLVELEGKTLGILGYGRIGSRVARIAKALGMEIIATTARPERHREASGVRFVSLEELLQTADVVSVHCPLTETTQGMISAEAIARMKPGAFFLNVSRGRIVDEAALADALKSGHLAGAGLDVLSTEPPAEDNPLIGAPNCIITPHIAWAPKEARQRLVAVAAGNLKAYLEGKPVNVVTE